MPDVVVKDGRAYMRDQQGRAFSVPEADVATELAAGSRVESPEEFEQRQIARERGTIGQQALTVAEGAAEGATLGLSTSLATELGGEEYRRAAKERAETNPFARGAGVVTGSVVPGLLSGGSGAVGSVARLTPAGALARGSLAVESAVARGLARAGIGGAGSGLVGSALARGASLGAAGAAEGAAYGLGSSLAESALEGTDWTADRALAGMADGALYGLGAGAAIGAGGAAASRFGRAAVEKVLGEGRTLRGAIQDFADNRTVRRAIGDDAEAFRKLTRNGEQMERIPQLAQKLRERGVTSADDVGTAVQREIDEAAGIAKTIEQGAEEASIRPSSRALLDEVDDQVTRLREVGTPDHAQMARMIEGKVKRLRTGSSVRVAKPDGTVERVTRDPSFEELRTFKTGLGEITNFARAHRNVAQGELSKLYGSVARTLEDTAEAMGPEAGLAYREAMRDMDDFITIRSAMKREAVRDAKKRLVQSGDVQTGIGGAIASLVMGSSGPMAAIAGLAASAGNKFIRERGAEALGKLADYALRTEFGMRETAKRLAGASFDRSALRVAVGYPKTREQKREDFERIRGTVLAYQQNPQAVVAAVERKITPYAREQPEVAFAMARRISEDFAWISSKIPPPITRASDSLTPLQEKPRLSARDEIRVTNYVEALAEPQSVFTSIATGRVNWDGIDALKERRPEMWESMRSMVIQETAKRGDALPYRRRIMLGLAFDFQSDWSMRHVGEIQKTGAMAPDTGNGKPAMGNIDTSDNALPGQPGAEETAA